MKAMIMAAGRGERLRPLTDHTPKPMLLVAGKPLIEHQIGWLRSAGINDIIINLHYRGDQIEAHLKDGHRFGVRISYSREEKPLETGGGIVQALPLLGDQPFLVLNGDNWIEMDLATLGSTLPTGVLAKLVLTPRPSFRPTGDFDIDGDVVSARGDQYVYCSVGVHHPALFERQRAEPFSLRDLWFAELANRTICCHLYQGFWSDIGTVEQLNDVRARAQ